MKPWVTLATAGNLVLQERDGEHLIRSSGVVLMSSRRHKGEPEMAAHAKGRTLIGGLGLGFTMNAVEADEIVVAEIEPAVVDWNRRYLGNGPKLDRVTVYLGDVATAPGKYDAILLDVDNGPEALTLDSNRRLYAPAGLRALRAALTHGGVLAVWSTDDDPRFAHRLGETGFRVTTHRVRARAGRGARHVIFVARQAEELRKPPGAR